MLKHKPRLATPRLATLVILMLLAFALLTFAFSPPVRAAVLQFLGSYNGADIAIDPETDSLVVSGDTSSVLYQDDGEIVIQNAEEEEAIAVIKPDTQPVSLADLLAQFPDFTLPTQLPPGYTPNAEATRFEYEGRTGLMVSWRDATGERITFYRGEQPPEEIGTVETSYVVTADLQGNDHAQLTWEADGYFYQIIATDETLTELDLKNIVPQ